MEYYDSLIISQLDFPEELMNYLVWHYTCRPAERPLTLSWRQAPFLIFNTFVSIYCSLFERKRGKMAAIYTLVYTAPNLREKKDESGCNIYARIYSFKFEREKGEIGCNIYASIHSSQFERKKDESGCNIYACISCFQFEREKGEIGCNIYASIHSSQFERKKG